MIDKPEFNTLCYLYEKYEPYQYFMSYLGAHEKMTDEQKDELVYLMNHPGEWKTRTCFINTGKLALHLPELRIMKIDEDLLPVIEDTKPDFSNLKLKYPAIFVNHQLSVGNCIINGFLLVDYDQITHDHPDMSIERDGYDNSIRILTVGIDKDYGFEFYSINPIDAKLPNEKVHISDAKEKRSMELLAKRARELACNLINVLVNDDKDITEVVVGVLPGQNAKRKKKGKLPLKDITYLRVGGTLKKYAREYCKLRGQLSVRFHVGGFWRNLTHERYKTKRKLWVKGHYRGMENMPDATKTHVQIKKIGGIKNENRKSSI